MEMEMETQMEASTLHKFPRSQKSLPQCRRRPPRETPTPAVMPCMAKASEPYPCTRSNLQRDKS